MIKYKEFYNEGKGIPEPIWGTKVHMIQCPTCGSRVNMRWSGSPDDPEEILRDFVRCGRCGHITDFFEARKQWRHHFGGPPLEVER